VRIPEIASLILIKEKNAKMFALKTQFFPETGPWKHFQDSGMRAIDSPHRITSIGAIFRK
jgi:hypothetical protein